MALDGAMNTITLHSPEEALVLIPHLLGYTPSNHLVFLALESWGEDAAGTRSCLGPIVSVDLNENEMNNDMGIALGRALSHAAIRQAVLVYYCSDVENIERLPREHLAAFSSIVGDVGGVLEPRYGTLLKSYVVGTKSWGIWEEGSLTSSDWSDLQSRPVAAALVFSGSAPHSSAPRPEIFRRPAPARGEAVAIGERWLGEIRRCGEDASVSVTGADPHTTGRRRRAAGRRESGVGLAAELTAQACAEWDRLIARWLDPQARDELINDVAACGRANAALSLVGVRDRVLYYGITPSKEQSLSELTEMALSRGLARGIESRPAVDHVENLIGLLDVCASYAGDNDPYALSCIGYLSWWYGQNTVAARYVKAALAADDTYPLATLLADSLAAMVTPAWLRRR